MCDFSKYGGRSEEWLAVEAGLPLSSVVTGQAVLERRALVNKGREEIAARVMESLSGKVRTYDHSIPTRDGQQLEARSYRSTLAGSEGKSPVYMHLHGGGFLFGTLASEDAICARIAINTGVVVVNVNYRHTPEFTYPTAWNDVEDAFVWLHSTVDKLGVDEKQVVVGGISAGGQLSAALTLGKHLGALGAAARACPPIAGQVLMIPCLVHMNCYEGHMSRIKDPSVASYVENENAPILSRDVCMMFLDLLKVDNPDANDLRLNPGNVPPEKVTGLPPTTIGVAGLDPLRDEGLLYAKMLSEAGVPTRTHIFKGLPHGFRRFGDQLSETKRWDKVVEDGIQWALGRPKATGQFIVEE
ncbi:hypothetical protein M406DRAFT_358509 [Cryphonectria parasitica EP155]|uniref:Alpha/beta hydrolase fold-3 domain-containing protein n=1 Tax=Cryphonectria parasitica (strain ATCC 38755 / EP155) TaxID=660469 RepID=A0A9P4XUF6_CRYP1|nr:uncharacterized protein M406DRAFT_358509 [Cryphonectria parasitica EP155]KAF3761188.1 hypothetical protein M406DRAFT_358509 [Cryphonectria parasitica EP155]